MERLAKKLERLPTTIVDNVRDGQPLTDHQYHAGLNLHPEERQAWDALKTSPVLGRKSRELLVGAFPKAVYTQPDIIDGFPITRRYLVKAYHDTDDKRFRFGQGHAEMISQSLYHAAGIPELHQKVWVDNLEVMPGETSWPVRKVRAGKQPMVVIAMDPRFGHHVSKIRERASILDGQAISDHWAKIGIMDALLDQIDRHGQNLLVGQYHDGRNGLLAIDNGMGQLAASYGGRSEPLGSYLHSSEAAELIHDSGLAPIERWEDSLRGAGAWFQDHAQEIYDEFERHLPSIQDDAARADHARHFLDRFDKVNQFARLVQQSSKPVDLSMQIEL